MSYVEETDRAQSALRARLELAAKEKLIEVILRLAADSEESAARIDLSRTGTMVKDRGYRQVWRFEHEGKVVPGIGIVGLQRDRTVIGLEGLCQLAALLQGVAQVVVGDDVVRIER